MLLILSVSTKDCEELTWLSLAGVNTLSFSVMACMNPKNLVMKFSLFFAYMKSKDISSHTDEYNKPL